MPKVFEVGCEAAAAAAAAARNEKILNEVDRVKSEITLDKPIYAGFCLLEISKVLMYEFHYDVMKMKYGANAQLLFTDTDSLCYHVITDDLYADMMRQVDRYE